MLDIHFIRENADIVKDAVKKKNVDVDIDRLLAVDEERKRALQELEGKRAEQNRASFEITRAQGNEKQALIDAMQQLKRGMEETKTRFEALDLEWTKLMLAVPNIPSPDTPVGKDESENVVVREWGEKPQFSFAPKPHWELGKDLGVLDIEKAAEVSGARFTYIKGDLALLQNALFQHTLSILTSRENLEALLAAKGLDIDPTPFTLVIPPIMMRAEVMGRMARLQPIDERYFFEKDNMVFIGSAEHTLGPLHMDEIIEESRLPLRYVAYTPAFRREAGAAGKDTRGILRQHQFDKIEMESFVRPEEGYREQDLFVAVQEYLVQSLKLPYQLLSICTGDMGKPDQRQFDINTWMPGQNAYRETHTSDYMGGYQARRLNTRIRDAEGNLTHAHMNDATAFAMGRILIAIMENYQQEDGSITIPEVLVPYVGKDVIRHTA
jgi:seryl-tRNA synthetase